MDPVQPKNMDKSTSRERTVQSIVSSASKLIEATLTLDYGVPPEEALRLEEELFTWFDRLSRRPGVPESQSGLRSHLISMTCKVGHVYWSGRAGEEPRDERVKRALALGPEIIAVELERRADRPSDVSRDD
jgi:hypothetical protein